VTSASVETAIVDFAKENGVDLIVLGSKGYSGIKKLLLGSVASAVLNRNYTDNCNQCFVRQCSGLGKDQDISSYFLIVVLVTNSSKI
jgi:Universal stress protein family